MSSAIPVTTNRRDSETNADLLLLAMRGLQNSAEIAHAGDYKGARINLISTQRLLQKALSKVEQQRVYINFIRQVHKKFGHQKI